MENLKNIFRELNIEFNDDKAVKYQGYMDEILDRNQFINLTAITEHDEFIKKHYIDSLLCGNSEEFI